MQDSPGTHDHNAVMRPVSTSSERAQELREDGREPRQRSHALIIGIRLRTAALMERAQQASSDMPPDDSLTVD